MVNRNNINTSKQSSLWLHVLMNCLIGRRSRLENHTLLSVRAVTVQRWVASHDLSRTIEFESTRRTISTS